MRVKVLWLLIFILGASLKVEAQGLAKVGTAGYQFLKIAPSARGMALGDAGSALIFDASAMFWNPALVNFVEKQSLFLSHGNYLADIKYDALGYAKNLQGKGIGVVGLHLIYLNSGDIEETTVENQTGTGKMFSAVSYSVGVTFARMLTNRFGVGFNLKYVNENLTEGLGEDNATGAWAVDMGTIYYPEFKGLESFRLTMSVRNFGPEVSLKGSYYDFDGLNGVFATEPSEYKKFPLPLTFRFGLGYDPIENENHKLSVAIIGEHPNDNLERLNFGAEYVIKKFFALRGGYILNHDTRSFSAGMGIKLQVFQTAQLMLDYGYAYYGVLEDVQMFSLIFNW